MLAFVLALVVGVASLAIYIAAFFFPEIHRKNDFIWSGVGLFYALVLWVFAPRITGGLLLGHLASVALLVWFGWQTLSLRRQLTPQAQQTQIPSAETVRTGIQEQVNKLSLQERLGQLQKGLGSTFRGAKDKVQQTVS
ncbi:MAG: Ycf66 family protein, partial [Nostoc sp.]